LDDLLMSDKRPCSVAERRLRWREVWILYRREMLAAFRERTIVVNSILIPLFLYPFLLWAMFTGFSLVMGQTEGFVTRVGVANWPEGHEVLKRDLERNPRLNLVTLTNREDARQKVLEGKLHAWLEFAPATGPAAGLPGNFEVKVLFDASKDRSVTARERVTGAIESYRHQWLNRESRNRGIEPDAWDAFSVEFRNVASKRQMGGFILGLMAPIIFVVMVAIGCFYPAVDAIAGERERGTWETLMSTAATRTSIAAAKYLYVASMGGIAGALNVTAVLLTVKPIFGHLLRGAGETIDFSIPLSALPALLLAAVLLAGFIAAGMMIFAAFARTFKEGQAMITPFYLLVLLPVVFLQTPGLKLTFPLALLPVVNITLMLREALGGSLSLGPAMVAVAASVAVIVLAIRLAAFILQFEDVVSGAFNGSMFSFIRNRVFKPRSARTAIPKNPVS
jgi:sodium transport system permease protein